MSDLSNYEKRQEALYHLVMAYPKVTALAAEAGTAGSERSVYGDKAIHAIAQAVLHMNQEIEDLRKQVATLIQTAAGIPSVSQD